MTLKQTRFLLGSVDFEIADASVRVRTKRLMNESSYEISFRDLDPAPSHHRSAPLQWLIFSVIFGGVTLFTLYGMLHDSWVPDKNGFVGTFLFFLTACLGCAFVFYRRKVDGVILRAAGTGAPVIFLHRRLPTELHVKEFVAIIQERIKSPHSG